MFLEIENGVLENVQGLDCWLPAVGMLLNPFNNKWEKHEVYRRNKVNFAQCKWERDRRWDKLPVWELEEQRFNEEQKTLHKKNPSHVVRQYANAEYQRFQREMWYYRLAGFWYYNNNKPTYITGQHWYYLSCYRLDTGFPDYRDVDRQFFYFWQYAVEDDECFGVVEVTKRRSGKTYRGGCIGLEWTSRSEKFNTGIQSKTDDDAAAVFRKAIVAPFRKLPKFFLPTAATPQTGKVPAKGLSFSSGKMSLEEDELESLIDYRPSNKTAYDGQKLGYSFFDEEGKTKTVDVNERWDIVKYCHIDHNGKIIGKSYHTTTVEDMDSGGSEFLTLWNGSNQAEKGGKKRTRTGLYCFFTPADLTRAIDDYGIADREEATRLINEDRDAVREDPRRLSSEIRKQPFTIKEAFQSDASSCIFNVMTLLERETLLKFLPAQYKTGDFDWKDGIRDTEAVFTENPKNGRFKILWEPEEGQRNRVIRRGDRFMPGSKEIGAAGIDPFNHKILAVNGQYTMSYGSICIIKKHSGLDETRFDGGPVLLYVSRPDDPETFYEDCLMALWYYGVQALIETNTDGIIGYFERRGCEEYAAWLPDKNKRGIANSAQSSGGGINGTIAEQTSAFINQSLETVYFPMLVDQWLRFSSTDTTEFDAAMAFGYANMLVKRGLIANRSKQDAKPITSYFKFWQKSSRRSGNGLDPSIGQRIT